jgi:NADH-quinone oxidoreductase subunit H
VTAILLANSMRMIDIVEGQRTMWFVMIQPVGALIFWIATIAEVNRAPFDMPEAEQELTAGYHAEYSGMKFALFFMAEYQKMIVICAILATLFFGGYREFWFLRDTFLSVDYTWMLGSTQVTNWFLGPLYMFAKVFILLFFMIWVRATFPRIRYDRLMSFGWKVLVPLALAVVFITATGILLSQELNNQLYFWAIPFLSIFAAVIAVVMIYRELRRKAYERA